jgi:hypothetical protein
MEGEKWGTARWRQTSNNLRDCLRFNALRGIIHHPQTESTAVEHAICYSIFGEIIVAGGVEQY